MTTEGTPNFGSGNDRRKRPRYAISPDFRLDARLTLFAGAESGPRKDWPGTLIDLSGSGAHVQVNLAAVAYPENPCRLTLTRGSFKLEIPGTVTHYVCSSRHSVCGVLFDFSYPGLEKAYLRVLEPAMVGASLVAGEIGTDIAGRHREEYRGKGSARLVVWRDKAGGAMSGFELTLGRFVVRLPQVGADTAANKSALVVRSSSASDGGEPVSAADETEARWLFGLAASNLAQAVPADVRKLCLALA